MNVDQILQQLGELRSQLNTLVSDPGHASGRQQGLGQLLEGLTLTIEELRQTGEDLRRQNEELAAVRETAEAERQRYQDLFDFAPDGYLITNIEGAIWEANHAAASILNVPRENLAGDSLATYILGDERRTFRQILRRFLDPADSEASNEDETTNPLYSEWEVRLAPKGKEPIYAALTIAPLRDKRGIPVALRWLVRDITRRVQVMEALRQAKNELETRVLERTAELQDANALLGKANEQLQVELAERKRSAEERERLLTQVSQERQRAEELARQAQRRADENELLLAKLDAEQATLKAIIANAPEAIIVADKASRVVLTNPLAERLYEHPGGAGTRAESQLCYANGEPCERRDFPLTRSALDGETYQDFEMMIQWPDGFCRNILVSAAPILDRSGNPNGAVAVVQEITERKKAEHAMQKSAARAEVLALLSQAFAEAGLDYPSVLSTITRQIADSLGDACILRLFSEDGKWVEPVSYRHPDPLVSIASQKKILLDRQPPDEGLAGQVIQSGQIMLIPYATEHEAKASSELEYWPWLDEARARSLLIVPLRAHGRLIGTLSLSRFHTHDPYDAEDRDFFQDLANQAALAIENARLYAAEAQRASVLDALYTATGALLTTLDLETLLGQILDSARRAIPAAERGALHLIAPDTGQLQMRAVHGYSDPRIQKFSPWGNKGYRAKAVKEKQPLLICDIREEPSIQPEGDIPEERMVRSALAAPLILGEQVFGVISLNASQPSAFSEADLRLLVNFAATTTAAIQNAMLHAEVQKLAVTDSLTEVYNRRGFFEVGMREMERARRFRRPLAAIMMDLDNFKEINDSYGHAVGDQVLIALADRVRSSVREVDIVGRYGGDEFAILLPEADLYTACNVAERIQKALAEPLPIPGFGPLSITTSLGVANLLSEGVDPKTLMSFDLTTLLDRADSALYTAKENGRKGIFTQ